MQRASIPSTSADSHNFIKLMFHDQRNVPSVSRLVCLHQTMGELVTVAYYIGCISLYGKVN